MVGSICTWIFRVGAGSPALSADARVARFTTRRTRRGGIWTSSSTARSCTLECRARKPAPTPKIYVQIEPTILDRKLAARHHPRRLQPKRQLEKIGVSHPLTIDSIPTNRSPRKPKKQPYPLNSARSQNGVTVGAIL